MKHIPRASAALALVAGIALAVTGCAPGASSSSTPSQSLGPVSKDVGSKPVTLTVWDQNTDSGIDDAQKELNAGFEKAHPNVTIKRVSRSFADLKTTLKLALSGDNPPDVVQANQGYPDMGAFVKAGYLRPVGDYAKLYGWDDYYPSSLLKLNSFSADGKTWQGDDLFGVSQTGELVGLYYNRSILRAAGVDSPPTTVAELTDDMQKVKAAGTLPLAYGDIEKSPGIHLYGFVLPALAGHDEVNDLVSGRSGSWTGEKEVQAATTIADWTKAGYVTQGANGVSRDDAVSAFGKGQAAFLITGTWYEATLASAPDAKDLGFTALTPPGASSPVTMGGEGLAWAITSKSEHPDAAAAYIDYITNADAAKVLVKTGNLPAVVPADDDPASGTVAGDITSSYRTISSANGITPYLDYATPTFYDTLTAAMQDLVAGQATPAQFTSTLQTDYSGFVGK